MLSRRLGPVTALFLFLALLVATSSAYAGGGSRDRRDAYERIYDATILNKPLDTYWREINSGWGPSLRPLRASLKQDRSYLVLHVVEPDPVYDLRSTEHLRKGIIARGLGKLINANLPIGHVFTSWRCQAGGQAVEGTTGLTGETEKQFFKMLTKGFGMTAFFSHFTDGHLQTPKLLDHEWQVSKTLHTLAIEVSDEVCANAMGFVRDFLTHPSRPYQNFGPNLDPTQFQGGGCGSFGVSILEKSGIWGSHPLWPFLWRDLSAPEELFGYGIEAPQDTKVFSVRPRWGKERDKVSMVNLIRKEWSHSGTMHRIRQQDPEMHLLVLKTLYRLNAKALPASFKARPEYAYRGLKVKAQDGWVEINGSFDVQAAGIVASTKAWWSEKSAEGYQARMGTTSHGFPAVILDRK